MTAGILVVQQCRWGPQVWPIAFPVGFPEAVQMTWISLHSPTHGCRLTKVGVTPLHVLSNRLNQQCMEQLAAVLQIKNQNQKTNKTRWQFHSAAKGIISLVKNVRNLLLTRIHHWSVSRHRQQVRTQITGEYPRSGCLEKVLRNFKLEIPSKYLIYYKVFSLNQSLQRLVFFCFFFFWKVRR